MRKISGEKSAYNKRVVPPAIKEMEIDNTTNVRRKKNGKQIVCFFFVSIASC